MVNFTGRVTLSVFTLLFLFSSILFSQEKPLEDYVEMTLEELMGVTITTAAKPRSGQVKDIHFGDRHDIEVRLDFTLGDRQAG